MQPIAEGLQFPEGPIVMPDGTIVLVEIRRGTLSRVSTAGDVDVVAELGGGPNGAAIGPDGRCYVCNNGGFEWHDVNGLTLPGEQPVDYAGGSIQVVDLETGEFEVMYSEVDGHLLRGPNDIVFDRSGGFWFTDHGKNRARDRDRGGLYYAAADGSSIAEVVYPLDSPNGVGLSPDEDRVYVAETHSGQVLAWDLVGPGRLAGSSPSRGVFIGSPAGRKLFDSLAMDAHGNVSVATLSTPGITTFTPEGTELEFVPTNDPLTTNIAFGGDDMRTAYITLSGTGRLVSTLWDRPGLKLNY